MKDNSEVFFRDAKHNYCLFLFLDHWTPLGKLDKAGKK